MIKKYFLLIILVLSAGAYAIEKNLPTCNHYDDIKKNHGLTVIVIGRYEVDLIQGGKKLQAATIVLSDKSRLIRSYRPIKKEYQFIGKQVKVIGKVYTNAGQPKTVQQVMAPHVYVESIELAQGETPYLVIPDKIPGGEWVYNQAQIEKNDDRWVHFYGKLKSVKNKKNDGFWADAVIEIEDGTKIFVNYVHFSTWQAFLNQMVTVTGIMSVSKEDQKTVYNIFSNTAICKGKVERCGIHEP